MSYKSPKWNNGSAPPLSAENMQALTDAVQENGEALAAMCNPNLLDNWYFGKPVNQMGQTEWLSSASVNVPCVDRWNWWGQYAAGSTLKLLGDGLQLIGTAGVAGLYQRIEQRIERIGCLSEQPLHYLLLSRRRLMLQLFLAWADKTM